MRASTYGRQSSNKAKSIQEQLEAGALTKDEQGWTDAGDYQDGRSASRFGTKVRGGWAEVQGAVKRGTLLDVLILWESSRGDRTPETWFAFLSSCRTNNVKLHIISHDRTYNLSNARDWKTLAEDGVNNAYESELLSIRTKRGHAGAAKKGLPPGGPTPYGYKRVFDENTGKRLGQEISPSEGRVIKKLFKDIAKGETILGISNALNASEKDGNPWTPIRVRGIARNPVYVALRAHNGTTYPGTWKPIVDKQLFYQVQSVLGQPGRRVTRPGRQVHLLSYLARCGECETYLDHVKTWYRCSSQKHCVNIPSEELDETVTELVLARLKQPDAVEALRKSGQKGVGENRTLDGDIKELKSRLEKFRAAAFKGKTTPESLYEAETAINEEIAQLETKQREQSLPPALIDIMKPGQDIAGRWMQAPLIARREIIKAVLEVNISHGGKGTRYADRKKLTLKRLRGSRWAGDTRTLGQIWDQMV